MTLSSMTNIIYKAMGRKFAPAYANIFMANWEEEFFAKCQKKPINYLRYLDDIWGLWVRSQKEFVGILNSHDPSIKLKYEINQDATDFLDTTVYKGPGFEHSQKLDFKVRLKNKTKKQILMLCYLKHGFIPDIPVEVL